MFNIKKNIKLNNLSRIGIGGIVKYYTEISNIDDFENLVEYNKQKNIPVFIIGGGTNILFSDNVLNRMVVKINSSSCIELDNDLDGVTIYVDAGVEMSKLVEYSLFNNFSGLEWAAGLPGTFGGAIFGNAGAFGGEVKDIILEVSGIDINENAIKRFNINNDSCLFGYRDSIFKKRDIDNKSKKHSIIFGGKIRLSKSKNIDIQRKKVRDIIKYRYKYHPMKSKTLGSTFANIPLSSIKKSTVKIFEDNIKIDPIPLIPVASILNKLGLVGYKVGEAEFSSKHPNFIINQNEATFKDVEHLINIAKQLAFQKFGIELREEIRIIK